MVSRCIGAYLVKCACVCVFCTLCSHLTRLGSPAKHAHRTLEQLGVGGGCVEVFSLTVTMMVMDYVTFYAEHVPRVARLWWFSDFIGQKNAY